MGTMSNNNTQKRLALVLCALVSYAPVTFFVNNLFNLFVDAGFIYDTLICYLILLGILISGFLIVFKNFKMDTFYFFMFLLIMYLLTLILHNENSIYMFTDVLDFMENPLYVLFIFAFPGYMFIRQIKDYDILFKYFRIASIITVIVSIFSFIILNLTSEQPQYMVFSYNMLVHTIFLSIMYFEKRRKFDLLLGIIGFMLIFLVGSRGALLSGVIPLILYFIVKPKDIGSKILIIFTLLLSLTLLMFFIDNILMLFVKLADAFNIDSRTLILIIKGDFFISSERFEIYNEQIANFNIFGHGLFGDRVISSINTYAHNIFIEILAQYGILIGGMLICIIFYFLIRGLSIKDGTLRILIVTFLSSGLIKLLFTGSYLNQEPSFYILLGLCVNSIKNKKSTIEVIKCKYIKTILKKRL